MADSGETTDWKLAKETELRLEVGALGPAYVKLVSGNAEIFGVELVEGKTYTLSRGRKVAVFTWYGAELQTWGQVASSYTSEETPMPVYVNLHQRLEARREEAKATGGYGPRLMIVGPTDSGKSTLSRVLCAYACRVGRCPTFVDLDIGQGEISVPGTLSATPLDRLCLSAEDEGGLTNTTPLSYFYGQLTPTDSGEVYKNYMSRLAAAVNRRLVVDDVARVSGLVINTMGFVEGVGYSIIMEAAQLFQADVIVVMGNDRLFAKLSQDLKGVRVAAKPEAGAGLPAGAAAPGATSAGPDAASKPITLVKLSRPGGVVDRVREFRRDARKWRLQEYFYGPARGAGMPPVLSPVPMTVGWDEVVVVRVGGHTADAGLVPVGKTSAVDPLRPSAVTVGPSLLNQILAVSMATSDKQVPHSCVAGFVHVSAVNTEARTLTLLSPCKGPLPSKYLVVGSISWTD